jgi:hypothetical protein
MQVVTQDGQAYQLRPGANSIGRGLDNTIIISHLSLSRKHAQLHWDTSGALHIMDVGSANGTWVENVRLAPGQWQPVPAGAHIRFGNDVICQVTPTPATSAASAFAPAPTDFAPPAAGLSRENGRPPALGDGIAWLIRAIDASLDRHKLFVAAGGSLLAAVLAAGGLWITSRLLRESAVLAILFALVGIVSGGLAMTLTIGAITRMAHADLTGRAAVSPREAVGFGLRRLLDLAITPLALAVLGLLAILAEAAILLIGRIDYLGEIVASALFVPALLVNLFLVILLGFGASLIAPIIVDRGRGVVGTLQYLYALMRRVPGRVVFYLGTSWLIAGVVTWMVWALVALAFVLTLQMLAVGLGAEKGAAVAVGDLLDWLPTSALSSFMGRGGGAERFTFGIAGALLRMGFLVTSAVALAFPLVLQMSLACAVYLHVRDEVPT